MSKKNRLLKLVRSIWQSQKFKKFIAREFLILLIISIFSFIYFNLNENTEFTNHEIYKYKSSIIGGKNDPFIDWDDFSNNEQYFKKEYAVSSIKGHEHFVKLEELWESKRKADATERKATKYLYLLWFIVYFCRPVLVFLYHSVKWSIKTLKS